jgi:hypothetical protein
MSVDWKEDIKSQRLIDKIYRYFYDTYNQAGDDTDKMLNSHKEYDTFTLIDGSGYARYNIEGTVAYIMDCIVIDGGLKTLRQMCKQGRDKFPYAKTIRFERRSKQRNDMRHFTLKDMIKKEV